MNEFEKSRYTLERTLLPGMFLGQKANMLNAILDKEGKFFTDAMAVYLGASSADYKPGNFKVYLQRAKSENKLFDFVVVKQPESDCLTLADTLYFCMEETTGETRYFLTERKPGNVRTLCSTDGENIEYHGELPDDADHEFQKMANIFIRDVHARFA